MWFNVWFVIWPRQKLILGGLAAGTPHPDAAKLAATAGKASRFNTYRVGADAVRHGRPQQLRGLAAVGMLLALVLGVGLLVRPDQAFVQDQDDGLRSAARH